MIQEFVDRYMANQAQIRAVFEAEHPSYEGIVKEVVKAIRTEDGYGEPNPENIHVINDGDYQGTLLFIIPEQTYQPSQYWAVSVSYGSCSGCDTLESIRSYSWDKPTQQQVDDYMTLALHVIQRMKAL